MRIAIIGGTSYVEEELEDFLYKLHAKYPDATIVIGDGLGAEKTARILFEAIGQTIEVPPLRPDLYDDAKTISVYAGFGQRRIVKVAKAQTRAKDIQVSDILATADIIVTVGTPTGSRASTAETIWKRIDGWREKSLQRPFHNVAAPAAKAKTTPKRPKKKIEQLAA